MEKELIIFDLDGTLAESKQPVDREMALLVCRLLKRYKVAVISGASYAQFDTQFLQGLECSEERLHNLYLLPTNGAMFYAFDGVWSCQYAKLLSGEHKEKIREAFEKSYEAIGYEPPHEPHGVIIEDRGTQMTFSALGQNASLAEKEAWDPDWSKRQAMKKVLDSLLGDTFEVSLGGTTSIDVTQKGVDKEFGVREAAERVGVEEEAILFVGDALEEGGNDFPATRTKAETQAVDTVEDTKRIIKELLV